MTMSSRGISDIQEKARGSKMKKKASFGGESKDMRKAAAPKQSKKSSLRISARSPVDDMSVGSARAPMPPEAGLRPALPGMKCGGKVKGYAKGGSIDGVATKGKTRGKIC